MERTEFVVTIQPTERQPINTLLEVIMFGECHAHIILDGIDYFKAIKMHQTQIQDTLIRKRFESYRDAGITFIRDGGDNCQVSAYAAHISSEYGIDYRTPLFAIHRKGNYGANLGKSYSNLSEYKELIAEVKSNHGDFIKLMISGIMDFQSYGAITGQPLSPNEIKTLIEIAHDEGFAVMAHANSSDAVIPALEAGVDSIEHGYYMNDECIDALSKSHCIWVPTLSPVANLLGSGRFPDSVLQEIITLQSNNIKKAIQAGAKMAIGSDSGSYLVPHVTGTCQEVSYLIEIITETKMTSNLLAKGESEIKRRFQPNYSF